MKMVVEFEDIRREFTKLRKWAEDALAQVEEAQLFVAPTPESNSLAVVMKHLAGNMRSRWTDFLTSDGEKPDRDRDAEFEIAAADDPAALFAAWRHGWDSLFTALDSLGPEDSEREVLIRGEAMTAMQAILRQAAIHKVICARNCPVRRSSIPIRHHVVVSLLSGTTWPNASP